MTEGGEEQNEYREERRNRKNRNKRNNTCFCLQNKRRALKRMEEIREKMQKKTKEKRKALLTIL